MICEYRASRAAIELPSPNPKAYLLPTIRPSPHAHRRLAKRAGPSDGGENRSTISSAFFTRTHKSAYRISILYGNATPPPPCPSATVIYMTVPVYVYARAHARGGLVGNRRIIDSTIYIYTYTRTMLRRITRRAATVNFYRKSAEVINLATRRSRRP